MHSGNSEGDCGRAGENSGLPATATGQNESHVQDAQGPVIFLTPDGSEPGPFAATPGGTAGNPYEIVAKLGRDVSAIHKRLDAIQDILRKLHAFILSDQDHRSK